MKKNTITKMTAAEKKAYDHYNRVYLGKNGGPTKFEMLCEIVGGIVLFAIMGALLFI